MKLEGEPDTLVDAVGLALGSGVCEPPDDSVAVTDELVETEPERLVLDDAETLDEALPEDIAVTDTLADTLVAPEADASTDTEGDVDRDPDGDAVVVCVALTKAEADDDNAPDELVVTV